MIKPYINEYDLIRFADHIPNLYFLENFLKMKKVCAITFLDLLIKMFLHSLLIYKKYKLHHTSQYTFEILYEISNNSQISFATKPFIVYHDLK